MNYLKLNIDLVGDKVKLKSMKILDVKSAINWSKHTDRLYADYDFPNFDNEEIIGWFKSKTRKNRVIISIFDFDDNMIGYISLRKINIFFKTCELGIVLNPSKINNGYGYDSIKTLANWYFNTLRYKKIYLSVAMYNKRAYKVYKKIGFKEKNNMYELFNNYEIDIYDKKYNHLSKYFKKLSDKIYVKSIKMMLSTLSTN